MAALGWEGYMKLKKRGNNNKRKYLGVNIYPILLKPYFQQSQRGTNHSLVWNSLPWA